MAAVLHPGGFRILGGVLGRLKVALDRLTLCYERACWATFSTLSSPITEPWLPDTCIIA
jgi:hypothetical protein